MESLERSNFSISDTSIINYDDNKSIPEDDLIHCENLFAFASANARSVAAKIGSVVDTFRDLDLTFMNISETWLKDDSNLRNNLADLEEAHGLSMITKCRRTRGGGVGIVYDKSKIQLSKFPVNTDYEIVAARGKTRLTRRPVLVVSYYIPLNITAADFRLLLRDVGDIVGRAKTTMPDPIIIVSGDANRRKIHEGLADFPDIQDVQLPPSRQGAALLRCASNLDTEVKQTFTVSPLESDDSVQSDHRIVVVRADLPRRDTFKKTSFTFRPYTKAGEHKFGSLLLSTDWSQIMTEDPSSAVATFDKILSDYTDMCFPEKRQTIKSTDLPWATARYKRKVRQRKRCFRQDGRYQRWKRLKKESKEILRQEREKFLDKVDNETERCPNGKAFYEAVKLLQLHERPATWAPRELFPGESDQTITEKIAEFFNKISREFTPLDPPAPGSAESFERIEAYQISARLRTMKKPKSRIPGDIDRRLNEKYSDVLAQPLFYIYETIRKTCRWPKTWNQERVSVIPKNDCPTSLSELRNLSCTPLYSKLLESFILDKLKSKVKLSDSQYGGLKGCGSTTS